MLLSELSIKDIVNEQDGSKIGKITDLEIDVVTGKVLSVKVQGGSRIVQMFNKNNVSVPWNKIIKIGSDVIIVDNQHKIDKESKN